MKHPLQITFRHMDSSPAVEARIRDEVDSLEQHFGRITSCRVVIEEPHRRERGNEYHISIDLHVPGSQIVALQCEKLGLDKIFSAAGFEWRAAGCSMCLAMNPDKLVGDQLCASSSNRNFKGRQGSATGRTVLMSPVMVAAAAITGAIADAREVFHVTKN